MTRFAYVFTATLALGAVLAPDCVAADGDKRAAGRERELARKLQLQQQEKSKLEQEKGELAEQLKQASSKAEGLTQAEARARREAGAASRELGAARKENAALGDKLKTAETELAETKRKLDETAQTLKQRDADKQRLERTGAEQVQAIARQSRLIETCEDRNAKLQSVGNELLQKIRGDRGAVSPVSGLSEIETFNLWQEYRDKIDAQKLDLPKPVQ